MNNEIRRKLNQGLTVLASAAWVMFSGVPVLADDTEIFFGTASSLSSNNPNVLMIIDTSGSMKDPVPGDTRDRLAVVQAVAKDLIADLTNVNVGLMRFDYDKSEWDDRVSDGGMVIHEVADVQSNLGTLNAAIDGLHHAGATPLAETYLEAANYFMGTAPEYGDTSEEVYLRWNSWRGRWEERSRNRPSDADSIGSDGNYISPIAGACQRNYIVYLSDGLPTYDKNGTAPITDLLGSTTYDGYATKTCSNDHGDTDGMCLDELAGFLYENDFSSAPGKQNVTSHFIGFGTDLPIFEDAAANGGGTYNEASNASQLKDILGAIINSVADTNDGFTAPAVTVNNFDRTAHLDQLFFTVFKPGETDHWAGNMKKYKFIPSDSDDSLIIVDKNGDTAVDPSTGFFYDGKLPDGTPDASVPTAQSYWSSAPDGADVTAGGTASLLTFGRKIITNPNDGAAGLLSANFIEDATDLATLLGTMWDSSKNFTAAQWLDWAAGVDIADADGDGSTVDPRTQMGAALHSKPAVVVYGGSSAAPIVKLFVGTNEGFLHAFDGTTGQEHFAFMPKDLWSNIPALAENDSTGSGQLPYGVDGHITIHKDDGGDGIIDAGSGDFVHLIFGLRRGGNAYYALDVTNINAPRMLWKFTTTGQSWSRPVIAKVNQGTNASPDPKTVVFVGGGYDPAQDDKAGYSDDSAGNSIHMLDAQTGAELWNAGSSGTSDLVVPEMKSSIPSTVRPLDMNLDGYADRLYVNDIAGRLFRFDVHHNESTHRVTAGVIASVGGAETPASTSNRRFYYAPDIALGSQSGQQFLTITMASGFRAHPLKKTISDYVYGVRDYVPFNKLGVDPLAVEEDYDYGTTMATMHNLAGSSTIPAGAPGWYMPLTATGEKALARSRIFQNKAYFTTYTPGAAPASNPCAPAVGSGKLMVIDLKTGLVTENTLQKPGIPPEVTFLFGEDQAGDEDDYDYCFGSGCSPDGGGGDPDDPDDPEESERDIQCLAGPEACDADANEIPQRTFWRQSSSD